MLIHSFPEFIVIRIQMLIPYTRLSLQLAETACVHGKCGYGIFPDFVVIVRYNILIVYVLVDTAAVGIFTAYGETTFP